METLQREHIHAVMRLAGEGLPLANAPAPDALIRESWTRCVHEHHLDPTRMQEAIILPSQALREHQERLEELLHIARHGVEALYRQVAGLGYCVLLTDARGVTVDFLGDLQLDATLRHAGLYLGSDWHEQHAGTCGVGTVIATGQALTVHQGDHFDATHIPLTCTAAPVYDPLGQLKAVLDISALTSPQAKSSQQLALQLVKVFAQRVENANFLRWFRNHWILRLHPSPDFVEICPDHLLALDAAGRIAGHNRGAQLLLEGEWGGPVLGLPFDRLFHARFEELGHYLRAVHSADQRGVTLASSGRVLFLHATPPPMGWSTTPAAKAASLPEARVPAPLARLSGGDPALDREIQRAARLVDTTMSVLLTGETGSGKEYFAQAMHQASRRRDKPFIAVNCAAIPETLIESELFGHLPGSFSGATPKGKRGLIQEADGGTLFLDEIGDMPLALQPRLLRVLAEREVTPIGGTRSQKVDVRVISATHADLAALSREGRFRDDLYFRLAGAQLALPPLRQRRDLPWIAHRMLNEHPSPPRLSPEVEAWLRAYPWPGNLRELKNVIAYACAMAGSDGVIGLSELPDALLGRAAAALAAAPASSPSSLAPEAQLLLQYLRAAGWSVSAVAHQLGVARMTVYRRMQRWGIRQPDRLPGEPGQ